MDEATTVAANYLMLNNIVRIKKLYYVSTFIFNVGKRIYIKKLNKKRGDVKV